MNTCARAWPALVAALLAGCASIGDSPGPPPTGTFTAEVQLPPVGTRWTVKETASLEDIGAQ